MASITTRKNGSRFIRFIDSNGQSQTITLGKCAMRYAESIKVKIEDLGSAMLHHHAPRDDTACWVADLGDCMAAKLERVGLIPPRITVTLKEWLEQYLAERKDDLKTESLRKLQQTKAKMMAFFDTGTELRKITVQQAIGWRQFLKVLKLSEAAIKTHSGNAKTMVNEAVKRKLIEDNPFASLRSGSTPSRYSRYVTPEDSERMVDACPDTEWKLLFGLARYTGLRIPSESQLLTWEDVDFERARLTVRSPKTERHAGHEQRIVPITPKLMTLLQNHFAEAEEGQQHLVTIRGKGAVIRKFQAIWRRAGVEPWKRLWQTLRQSCEQEWAMEGVPQFAVSLWMGHSMTVSGRHYANNVPDELFARVAGLGDGAESSAHHNAHMKLHETAGNGQKQKRASGKAGSPKSSVGGNFPDISGISANHEKWSRGESNPRPVTVSKPPLHA